MYMHIILALWWKPFVTYGSQLLGSMLACLKLLLLPCKKKRSYLHFWLTVKLPLS